MVDWGTVRFARTFMLSMAILYMFQVVREPIDVTREEIEKAMERLNHREVLGGINSPMAYVSSSPTSSTARA